MPASLPLSAQDRLLVIAPHPDDETLAAGELIQAALAAGAAVRVLYATDGDNNPWPQRWIEKRWRIDASARERWGPRRRDEPAAALPALAPDHAVEVLHLGWPDQGLTDALMRDDAPVARLRAELDAFAPTHLVMPSLADRHPDHSALHVMLELALLRRGRACQRLAYLIHADGSVDGILLSPLQQRQARKRAAMEAYASQLSLSRGRLLALATRAERYAALDADFSPRAATAAERAAWIADGSGIPPGAGVGIVDPQPLADLGLSGLQCLRALWTGEDEDAQRVHTGVEETRAAPPRAGLPVVVIHGTDDGLVPPAFSTAPYVAMARAAGRDVRYWQVRNAQHFDGFLALPHMAAAYLPLLPYVYDALDRIDAHLDGRAALPEDAVVATVPRMGAPLGMQHLALPR